MNKKAKNIQFKNLGVVRILQNNIGIICGFLLVFVIMSIASDKFLTVSNMANVMRQVTTNMILSFGVAIVLIFGNIDLSVPAILGMTACLSAGFIESFGFSTPVACGLAILAALVVGAINGFLVTTTNIHSFIITLAMQNVCRGICRVYTGQKTIIIADKTYINLGTGSIFGIPVQAFWILCTLLLTVFILRRTTLGRHIYAAGGNKQAAVYSGINVKWTGMFVYLYAAFMAALAGIYTAGRTFAAMYSMGEGAETNAISAVVLGGISMSGGVGGIFGVIFGVLLIGILNNGLNLLGINSSWQYVVQGLVILFAVYTDFIRKKKKK